ncbi:MAG: DUF1565 domain-containing protein [Pseudanabaenaceae cyanobacterium SKYGB_i_bin29]|nr:DUF1565 domain-containing protein [Pseudanabaenaceae cyanobacterium SKYG29]MDW8421115.1 DUF1565 domain-containing protein [Pseudanabaenaceae cyanobacterium SKYGB_i_bin29]
MRCLYPIGLALALPSFATTLVVHPQRGNDLTGNGTLQRPFRTVSHALALATSGTTIVLQPGIYNTASGERFPWVVRPGIILRGNEAQQGQGVVVIGGGTFRSVFLPQPNATIIIQDRTELRGLTISNPQLRGYGIWQEEGNSIIANNTIINSRQDGILLTGNTTSTVSNNRLSGNNASNITIEGAAQPLVQQNSLERSRFGISIRQQAVPQLVANTIAENDTGIIIQGSARPLLRQNNIYNNRQAGIITLNDSSPDLGNRQNPGQNIFRSNGRAIHNNSSHTVIAWGNQFDRAAFFGAVSWDNSDRLPSLTSPLSPPAPFGENREPPTKFEPIPNSVVVRIAGSPTRPVAVNSAIDPNLPPVTALPPADGRIVADLTPVVPKSPTVPLRFRVVVPVNSEAEKIAVRQMLPGAFPLNRSGQLVVQVGAFNRLELAQEQVRQLANQGITAILEPISP